MTEINRIDGRVFVSYHGKVKDPYILLLTITESQDSWTVQGVDQIFKSLVPEFTTRSIAILHITSMDIEGNPVHIDGIPEFFVHVPVVVLFSILKYMFRCSQVGQISP